MNRLLLLSMLLMLLNVVQGKRHYVGFDSTNSAPAGSVIVIKTTNLGADLLSVTPAFGDTVFIAWGRYYLTSELMIPAGVVVQGGYNPDAGTVLTRTYPGAVYPSDAPTFANMTILDGNAFFTPRDKKHRVATVRGALETCYIRGGHTNELNGTAPEKLYGGGLYIDGGTVVSCIVRGNVANNITSRATTPALGGGAYLTNGGRIYNSLIVNNMANDGYGVYGEAGCVITNSTIVYNTFAPMSVPVSGTGPNIAQNVANVSNYYYHQVHSTVEITTATYATEVKVQLTDFYLSATETTCLQYCVFLASIDYTINSSEVVLAEIYRDSLWTLKVYGSGLTGEAGNKTVRAYYGTDKGGSSDETYCNNPSNGYKLCATLSSTSEDLGHLYQRNNIIVPRELTGSGIIPDDDIAICFVSWYGGLAYCQWLGGSLPTEAQFEFALRRKNAGPYTAPVSDGSAIEDQSASLYNYAYPYAGYISGSVGNVFYNYDWAAGNSNDPATAADYGSNRTHNHKVGEKLPNGLGLYDMNGNMREWCADFWISWDYATTHYSDSNSNDGISGNVFLNPINNVASYNSVPPRRIARGGRWIDSSRGLRSGCRNYHDASYRHNLLGFRPSFFFPFLP